MDDVKVKRLRKRKKGEPDELDISNGRLAVKILKLEHDVAGLLRRVRDLEDEISRRDQIDRYA